jgi:signal transduction histidine kinase
VTRRLSPLLAAALRAGGSLDLRLPSRLAADLDRRFARELRAEGCDAATRRALLNITPGAASRAASLEDFLEQVQYNGRRLAKLDSEPARALALYDRYAGWLPPESGGSQLRWAVALALGDSFGSVRHAEAQTFFELADAELRAHGVNDLIDRALAILARAVNAKRGAWQWEDGTGPVRAVYLRGGSKAIHSSLRKHACCWSVPVTRGGRLVARVQFGFAAPYRWLPREVRLIQAAAERCAAWTERARLLEDSRRYQEKIRSLAAHSLQVEENERRRIRRELHDETGQSMLFMRLELEMLEARLAGHPSQERVAALRQLMERSIADVRRAIAALSPYILERYGLAAAFRRMALSLEQAGMRVHLRLPRGLQSLPKPVEIVLYRVLQESCNNVLKHASAKTVKIRLRAADTGFEMTVADDGRGFEPRTKPSRKESFGLSGMAERVALVGGSFEIGGGPGEGAAIRVVIPVSQERISV